MVKISSTFNGQVFNIEGQKETKCLQFSDHADIKITVRVQKTLNTTKQKLTSKSKIIQIQVGNTPLAVKIKDLASALGMDANKLKVAERDGILQQTINQALEIISKPLNDIDKLNGIEVIQPDGKAVTITQDHVDKIKKCIAASFGVIGTTAGKTETLHRISEGLQLRVKSSGTSLVISSLFGKFLAKGGAGKVVMSPFTLVVGKADTGKHEVVKIPLEESKDIDREVAISKKLNKDGPVLGIQERLHLRKIKDLESDKEILLHSGKRYESDLTKVIGKLSDEEIQSVGYQMFSGVLYMHKNKITHGDIKPENYFFNRGPAVYLGDLAGAIDHTEKQSEAQMTFSSWRPTEDVLTGKAIMRQLNQKRKDGDKKAEKALEKKFFEHEQKADVFCVAATFALLAVNPAEFSLAEVRKDVVNHMQSLNIAHALQSKGWSENFSKILEKCLVREAASRPTMQELMKAYTKEMKKVNPELLKE